MVKRKRTRTRAKIVEPELIELKIPAPKSDEELPPVELAEVFRLQVFGLKSLLIENIKANVETMRDLIQAQETLTKYRKTILQNMEMGLLEAESDNWPRYEHCEWNGEYGWKWKEGHRPYYLDDLELIEADRIIKKYVKDAARSKSYVPHSQEKKPRRRTRAEMEAAGEKPRSRSRSRSSKPVVAVAEPEPVESTNEQEVQTISYDG